MFWFFREGDSAAGKEEVSEKAVEKMPSSVSHDGGPGGQGGTGLFLGSLSGG
jgi:hypothetical protein